jgi:hypothetical protein
MNAHFLTSLFFCALLFRATAASYTIQLGNVNWNGSAGGYACFSGTAYPNTINFTITKAVNGRANYAVTAGPSQNTGSYTRQLFSGGNALNYALYTTSAMTYQLKAPTTATANEVISGSLAGQSSQVVPLSFVFYIPPGQVVPPGTYTDRITFSVYPAYNSTGPPDTTVTITFSAVVAAGAAISIVPTGGSFNSASPQLTLDFGTLQTGQSQGCDVLIKQNNNCTVNYSSANSGVLKQVPTPTTDQIPYTLSSSGTPINLTQPGSITLPSGVSPQPNGNRYPITITIGTVGNPAAGTYQDEITISVVAQ